MSEKKSESESSIRRILIAMDASSHSEAAMEVAVELASAFHAEVMGLFIEDIHLLNLAQSQTARVISSLSPILRPLMLHELELHFRSECDAIREQLRTIAGHAGVSWKFHVARGPVPGQLLAEAANADLVILGKTGRSFGSETREAGSTVRALVTHGQASALILQYGIRFQMPISLFYDGSALSQKAMEVAAQLVHIKNGSLTVFLLAHDREEARELREEAEAKLAAHNIPVEYRRLVAPSVNGILLAVQQEGPLPLVLPAESEFLKDNDALRMLINQLPNPILIIR